MSTPMVGLLVGMALGLAAALGGFGAFLLVAALGVVGFLVGRFLDGDLDISELFSSRNRRR
jgi:ABC-type sulfate transport system permease component